MLRAYTQSAASLNLLRGASKGGYADLHRLHAWTMDFTENSKAERYRDVARRIQDSLDFMSAAGFRTETSSELSTVNFYTSHEALLLEYEEALTRIDAITGQAIAGSGHMLWIGDRTRQPDGAHVEFCRASPIRLASNAALPFGRRRQAPFGEAESREHPWPRHLGDTVRRRQSSGSLPSLIWAVETEGATVVWSCDPMHGNTIKSRSGYKARSFDTIRTEVQDFFAIHRAEGTQPGGIHLEMTGKDVTECTGGMYDLSDADLSKHYATACDPRLNACQALELAFLIAENVRDTTVDHPIAIGN